MDNYVMINGKPVKTVDKIYFDDTTPKADVIKIDTELSTAGGAAIKAPEGMNIVIKDDSLFTRIGDKIIQFIKDNPVQTMLFITALFLIRKITK